MKNKYILILLLALTGCKYSFQLDYMDVKPMAAIRSYVCADSLVVIDIQKTVPLAQLAKVDTTLVNPHYSIKCNGVEVSADESMIGAGHMVLKPDSFRTGDKIEIVFGSDDTETAVASTIIPGSFPEYELELCNSNNAERNLKIRYKDDPKTTDYYGAVVTWKGLQEVYVGLDEKHVMEVGNQEIIPPSGYNDIQLEPEAYSPLLVYFNGDYLFIWKDSDEEDNEYDLCYSYRPQYDGSARVVIEADIQCSLLKLSEEMYRHLFAEFDCMNNPFMEPGLSSPAFTYTNVRNGLGYLCGYSSVKTDWIKDTLFEKR